jgi:peptidoglycan-associated lipoprotein
MGLRSGAGSGRATRNRTREEDEEKKMGTYRESRIVVTLLLLTLAGCAERTATTQPAPPAPTASLAAPPAERIEPPQTPPPVAGTQAPPSPPAPTTVPAPIPPAPKVETFTEQPALKDVLFDANRGELGRHGTEIMRNNARWLIENPGLLVLIEGHSDYKGNREGNMAAGERRAKAAMDFLTKAGVSASRIQIVSYGSDRPVCSEKTEACAAKSRRVHFLVKPQ